MTTSDIAAALTSAVLVTFVATLIIREHLRERGVAQALLVADMRAREIADDAWMRYEAERRSAALDDDEAVAEWLEAGS